MFRFILDIPYTIVGLIVALVSIPTEIKFKTKPYAFVLEVKSF